MKKNFVMGLGLASCMTLLICNDVIGQSGAFPENPVPNKNTGVWSYGKGSKGGDFTPINKQYVDRGVDIMSDGDWQGVYWNNSGKSAVFSQGLTLESGKMYMHPANAGTGATKIVFTAPNDGEFEFESVMKTIDVQAKKVQVGVYTNAVQVTGSNNNSAAGYKELYGEVLNGHNQSTTFNGFVRMKAGEKLSFELANGGDRYTDDMVEVELTVIENDPVDKVQHLSELKNNTKVQFRNIGTGEFITLMPDPRGGGCLEGRLYPDEKGWFIYQADNAAAGNCEVKRNGFNNFNWSNYDNRDDSKSFIAWNHAKRTPNTITPQAPHDWTITEVSPGVFRIDWVSGECMEVMPLQPTHIPGSKGSKVITRQIDANNQNQLWEIELDY